MRRLALVVLGAGCAGPAGIPASIPDGVTLGEVQMCAAPRLLAYTDVGAELGLLCNPHPTMV